MQCTVIIRGVDVNLNITEELLDLVALKDITTGRDIFQGLEECLEKAALPWSKLISLAMDSVPAMFSANIGVVGLLKSKLNSLTTP